MGVVPHLVNSDQSQISMRISSRIFYEMIGYIRNTVKMMTFFGGPDRWQGSVQQKRISHSNGHSCVFVFPFTITSGWIFQNFSGILLNGKFETLWGLFTRGTLWTRFDPLGPPVLRWFSGASSNSPGCLGLGAKGSHGSTGGRCGYVRPQFWNVWAWFRL